MVEHEAAVEWTDVNILAELYMEQVSNQCNSVRTPTVHLYATLCQTRIVHAYPGLVFMRRHADGLGLEGWEWHETIFSFHVILL